MVAAADMRSDAGSDFEDERSTAFVCPEKSLADLEWPRLLEALASRCVADVSSEAARVLPFLEDREDVDVALREVTEAITLDAAHEPLERRAFPDIADALVRARAGLQLSGREIIEVAKLVAAAEVMHRFLKRRAAEVPALARACAVDEKLFPFGAELSRSFESDGTLADDASPRLASLRSERKATRERLLRRLQEIIGKYRDQLQDGYWTERDGRYVLPLRSDAEDRFPGIVHSASAGGSTLFVEPRVVVPMGNRQKVLAAQVEEEEARILTELSERVASRADALDDALTAVVRADLRGAAAKLAVDLGLSVPEVVSGADVTLDLVRARHPLLAAAGTKVVASDLSVKRGGALLISGPNAGGKTVALKTMGLAVLMLRAGLPVPADPGSRVALFDAVLTDVGDDQSLVKNLSSFSAHIKNLGEILDRTAGTTLVLLDEIASGTDPKEGEALATAVLDALVRRGGSVAATTHYEGLKVLALSDTRFTNASVGFDFERMIPTFRLHLGIPGASSALTVARRFGIPDAIVERAKSLLSTESHRMSETVSRLERELAALDRERAKLDADRRELDEERSRLADLEARLQKREEARVVREGENLVREVKRARDELEIARMRMRSARTDAGDLSEASRAIDRAAHTIAIGGPLDAGASASATKVAAAPPRAFHVGMKVHVPRLRADAEVIEVMAEGQLRLQAGPLKLLARQDEVRPPSKEGGQAKSKAAAPRMVFDAAADPETPIQTSDNTIDLRGLRAHEALAIAEQFLDRCIGAGKRVAFLVHGHGTGALRIALRDSLRTSPYVARSRPGEHGEGGDGVTIVWLK